MKNTNKFKAGDISDEQLIDFICNEITDPGLKYFIETSPELKTRLNSYKEVQELITQLEPLVEAGDSKDNYNHIIQEGIRDSISDKKFGWINKIKTNVSSALTLDQSPAFYGLAASMLLVAGLYLNSQSPVPEWHNRYTAMGFESNVIDSSDWFMSSNNINIYAMPNRNSSEPTTKINNLSAIKVDDNDSMNQVDVKETNVITPLNASLMTINDNLTSNYLIGVLFDMSSKEIPVAQLSEAGNEPINLNLYGNNTSKDDCILGEIGYKLDMAGERLNESKFFNFCAYDTSNPLQLIN